MKVALIIFISGLILTPSLVALWAPHFSLSVTESNGWDVLLSLAMGTALMTVVAAAVILALGLRAFARLIRRSGSL